MNKLEVFFDYSCPYCLKGHENLLEILPDYPDIQPVWCPCEAHPRPETYEPHSDLCIQGMFYVMEHGLNLMDYHSLMYKACLTDRIDAGNLEALAGYIDGSFDGEDFKKEIKSGKYINALAAANRYAYEKSRVWAVPSYRLNGMKLHAIENIGVTKEQLKEFINQRRLS